MKKLRLQYVFKLPTSYIEEQSYNVNITIDEARKKEMLVAIGHNQTFRQIERILGTSNDYELLDKLYEQRNKLKYKKSTQNNIAKITNIQNQIDKLTFQENIITIKVEKSKHYQKLCRDGVFVNGIKFVRLMTGGGCARRSTSVFCNETLYDKLKESFMNGLQIDEINIAKFSAYEILYFSAMHPVSTPRVCVISDKEEIIKGEKVDFVIDKKGVDFEGNPYDYREIEERDFDFEANLFDGQGLIKPSMAQQWSKELELGYESCHFITRFPFGKGLLVEFDVDKFAEEVAHTDTIIDYWGKPHKVKDIDVIITTSQFKMYKRYKNWDEYMESFNKYHHTFGVTRVSPERDKEYSTLNYQYIQTLNLTDSDLQDLAQPTIDWINKICSGDRLYSLLFLNGVITKSNVKIDELLEKCDNNFIKALLLSSKVFDDEYVQRKIYQLIQKKIDEAKIGRIWVKGNYSMMISCPYELCNHAFKLEDKHLLQKGECYNKFWIDKGVKKVDTMRSPMVDPSEHNIVNIVSNEKMNEWYKYIYTGTIYNTRGLDTIRHSDSDWDGDIVFSTDNEIIMKCVYPNRLPITYEKSKSNDQKMTRNNIVKSDLKSFNSTIGQTTNYSTKFFSMLCNYKEDSREYQELEHRIKLLRRYIGDSIDMAKGIQIKPFPKLWKSWVKFNNKDTEEIKKEKWFYNNLVAKKKPYFFIYVYDDLKTEHKQYIRLKDRECRDIFGCKIRELKEKEDKTQEEKNFLKSYYNKMPVTKTNCIVNKLAWMIEDIERNYKYNKNESPNEELFELYIDKDIEFNKKKYNKVADICLKYNKALKNKVIQYMVEDNYEEQDDEDFTILGIDNLKDMVSNDLLKICPNQSELTNYIVRLCYKDNLNVNRAVLYDLGIDGLIENIKKNSFQAHIVVEDENGQEYLGKKYSLKDVVN